MFSIIISYYRTICLANHWFHFPRFQMFWLLLIVHKYKSEYTECFLFISLKEELVSTINCPSFFSLPWWFMFVCFFFLCPLPTLCVWFASCFSFSPQVPALCCDTDQRAGRTIISISKKEFAKCPTHSPPPDTIQPASDFTNSFSSLKQ